MSELDRIVALHMDQLAGHVLLPRDGNPYRCKSPQRSAHWFAVEPICDGDAVVIYGDHHIVGNGAVSRRGYGLAWFVDELSPAYLAEKILEKRWTLRRAVDELQVPAPWTGWSPYSDLAAAEWDEEPDQYEEHPNHAEREALLEALDGCADDYEGIEILKGQWHWDWGDPPGYGYDLVELGSLVAVQRTFRRLYLAAQTKAVDTEPRR